MQEELDYKYVDILLTQHFLHPTAPHGSPLLITPSLSRPSDHPPPAPPLPPPFSEEAVAVKFLPLY